MRDRSHRRLFSALSIAALVGCTPSKTVTIRSTPPGATLTLIKVAPEGQTKVALDGDDARAPVTIKLEFPPDVRYRVEAHRVLCDPAKPITIEREPQEQGDYAIKLTAFKQFVDALVFAPRQTDGAWRMVASPTQTTATIATPEPDPVYVDQPTPLTDGQHEQRPGTTVDFPSFAVAAGSSGTVMVYEQVRTDPGTPGGLDSKLFKLRLGTGEVTALTTNHQQQHNPTFSYSGEDVIFDTDDDSRTRAPIQFRLESNEATVTHLQHDADTCEVEFSAGRDALALTAYTPNTPGPQVMVAALDGSGLVSRGPGMSPQVSSDGNRIAFVHRPEKGGHLRLATVNVRGPITTQEIQLDADHDVSDPHWSPDGKLIAYCSDARDGKPVDEAREPDARYREPDRTHSFLWVVRADGQSPIQLTHGENFDSHPVFDPDGRTVYFRSNRGGSWNVWRCRLSDAAMARLAAGR